MSEWSNYLILHFEDELHNKEVDLSSCCFNRILHPLSQDAWVRNPLVVRIIFLLLFVVGNIFTSSVIYSFLSINHIY